MKVLAASHYKSAELFDGRDRNICLAPSVVLYMNLNLPNYLICIMNFALLFPKGGRLDHLVVTTLSATLSLPLYKIETKR